MPQCLIALGSNLGDRQATLEAALKAINRLTFTRIVKVSRWYETQPIGGPAGQPLFFNGAALIDTELDLQALYVGLRRIEAQAGRSRRERWSARSLDIDLLLVGDEILLTPDLEVPHARLSFRRFVLEPAVEIAPDMVHPTLGGTLQELLDRLNSGADICALLAMRPSIRRWLADRIVALAPGAAISKNTISIDESRWPSAVTSFIEIAGTSYRNQGKHSSAPLPKLNVVLETDQALITEMGDAERESIADLPSEEFAAALDAKGRGPSLVLRSVNRDTVETELKAALDSVWPALGSPGRSGVK